MDVAPRDLDIPALTRRYGRALAAAAYVSLQNRRAAETAAAVGIADVLRSRGTTSLPDAPATAEKLTFATLRRAEAAHRTLREVDADPLSADAAPSPSFAVTPESVEVALAGPGLATPRRMPAPWLAVATLTVAIGAGAGLWRITSNVGAVAAPVRSLLPATTTAPVASLPLSPGIALTLADCQIQPAETPVSFRGWLTTGDLTAPTDAADAARRVYALVTASDAEWLGWHTEGSSAMYPRVVGRLACAVDPILSTVRVYAVPGDWQPPTRRRLGACPARACPWIPVDVDPSLRNPS